MSKKMIKAITDMREEDSIQIAGELLDKGMDPLKLLEFGREALLIIGKRFENEEAFMPELIMSGEIMRQISDLAKPKLEKEAKPEYLGTIVFGTVEGDIHDLAKDIVVFMLDIHGFKVIDLGVDVSPEDFVEKIKSENASILGLSGFLHLASESMKRTVDALKAAGLRENVRVMIGGGQIDDHLREYTGADNWGRDAMKAVSLANTWSAAGVE